MDTKYRVVFHLDTSSVHKAAAVLNNIQNLLDDLGDENVQAELVANGEGVLAMLRHPNQLSDRIESLYGRGVVFSVCANALRSHELVKEDLLEPTEIVTSGVGQLVRRQAQGWAYIKP